MELEGGEVFNPDVVDEVSGKAGDDVVEDGVKVKPYVPSTLLSNRSYNPYYSSLYNPYSYGYQSYNPY